MVLKPGDRVRVITPESPYTGCRGTVREDPGAQQGVPPLGYYVAIDGENGRAFPFLAHELQRLLAVKAQPRDIQLERQRGT